MAYGLTSTGFVPKPQEIIEGEIQTELKDAFGSSIRFDSKSVFGQISTILAERFALLWELAEAVNASQNPDAATGARLDELCALTGTIREAATSSTVDAWLTGDNATNVPLGSLASTTSTGIQFQTIAAYTLATATSWAGTTAYVVGDIVTNASRCYYCITAGTSAGSGGPTSTSDDITDGTAHWQYMGEGAAYADASLESVETGPLVALAGDLTTIDSPVAGWDSVKNREDATPGTDIETDAALRVRREDELAAAGTGTIDAVRAALLDVSGVDTVNLFVNSSDVTDGDGVPPHAVEALVNGTQTDQDIFDALLANVPIGIQTHGTTVGTADDSEGTSHTMKFTKPTEIEVHVEVDLDYDADLYPADGDAQVKAAIAALAYVVGQDVHDSRLSAAVFSIPGVVDVTDVQLDTDGAPIVGTSVAIDTREIADLDTSRVTVNSSAV